MESIRKENKNLENINLENINLDSILERNDLAKELEDLLYKITNSNDLNIKKGIYISGPSGIGKTTFVVNLLKKLNYEIIYYDNSIKNKNFIESLTNNNLSTSSVYSLFYENSKKNVIVIDDVECLNSSDKNVLTFLIKLIRQKKTKKQKLETSTNCPIIFINSDISDKKINELICVTNCFNLNKPNNKQLTILLKHLLPNYFNININNNNNNNNNNNINNELILNNMLSFLDNKLYNIKKILFYYKNNILNKIFNNTDNNNNNNNNNNNIKNITKNLLQKYYNFDTINNILESDRTSVALLFHENIIKVINNDSQGLKIYLKILDNFSFCDYIDRYIFKKQIWQLTEINYITKIFYNNYILNEYNLFKNININNILFTKILTKYSSEYNNYIFLYNLMQTFLLEKKELFALFIENFDKYNNDINEIFYNYNNYNITKLEIQRLHKFINNLLNYNNNSYSKINEELIDEFMFIYE